MIESFYTGMKNAALQYNLAIAGGDTSASQNGLMISVTVMGETHSDKLAKRSSAQPGDFICVSGVLGGSNAGLKILMREKQLMLDHLNQENASESYQIQLDEYRDAVSRHLLPKARLDIVKKLDNLGIVPTAMIDVSDGLASETRHICMRSGCGAVLYENKIPIMSHAREVSDEFKDDVMTYALFGGEDYELLFTVKPEDLTKIEEKDDLTIIGQIKPKEYGIKLTDIFGKEIDLEKLTGFQHFIPHAEDDDLSEEEDIWGES
jgi:thiamine-monophosphate kinase